MQPAQMEQNRRDLSQWARTKTRWTIGEVADYVTECGSHFFTRETMKFWGDTRANWRARMIHGRLYVERIKAGRGEAGKATRDKIGRLRPVDFERGCIGVELSESEQLSAIAREFGGLDSYWGDDSLVYV